MSTETPGADAPSTDSALGSAARTSILRASAIMASGTMVSRILGFIRSAMLLAAIGAAGGGVSAAFQTANTLPNTVFNLLASGIFDAVLVPQIVGALKRRHDGQTYVNRLLTLAGTLLFLVTIVSMIAAPLLVVITAAGYDSEIRTLAILFALLCLPQLFFYGLYNLLGELLNARGVFGPYMWAPVVNNVVGIAGLGAFLALWGGTEGRIEVSDFTSAQFWVLGGSATLGVIAQALVLVIPMKRAGVRFTPDFHFRGTSFGSTSKVAGWTFATLGVSQVGVLSTNNLAALADAYAKSHDVLIAGINAYATAFMIFMVPQSLITVSLTTAIFTRMAESVADRDDRGVAASYDLGVRTITSLTLLATAILMAASVPMMQMVLYSTRNEEVVSAYAWILVALMPGVASTGMVLMSQRVFFAYEDVKPVFLMGIGPTILQVVVGWSMYALTGAKWWVVGAALGETACRLVQGVVAVVWVAKRNPHVDRVGLLRSYASFLASALLAGGAAFGALSLVGVHTRVEATAARFGIATLKVILVGIVASLVYMLVLRLLSPADSGRTIAPLLARVRVPAAARSILAAPLVLPGESVSARGIMGADINTDTEGLMNEDEPRVSEESEEPTASDLSDAGVGSESASALPSFEEILSPADSPSAGAPEAASAGASAGAAFTAAGAALGGWAKRVRAGIGATAERAKATPSAAEAEGGLEAEAALEEIPAPPPGDEEPIPAMPPVAPEAAPEAARGGEDAAVWTPPAFDPQDVDMPPLPGEESAEHASGIADEGSGQPVAGHDRVGTIPPLGAGEESSSAPGSSAATPSSRDRGSGGARPGAVYNAQGKRLIDPTKPTLIFAAVLTVIAGFWAVTTALAPVTDIDIAQSIAQAQSGKDAQSGEGAQSEPSATTPETVAPAISSLSVLSWSDDGGDHPDMAVNMIDGNPDTEWHSRWYDYNQFLDTSNVTIVVKLQETSTVSSITLRMDASTSGGELVVRNVTDPANPRGGTELTTTALSPTTEIALPQPVTTDSIALSFRSMPTSVDGNNWAWISELAVK